MLVLDTEVYESYFLLMFKEIESGKIRYFEQYPDHPFKSNQVRTLMRKYTTVSFNGNGYDLPMIVAALEGFDNESLKAFSDKIIKSNKPTWSICKTNDIHVPWHEWDHVDLMDVAPGIASLKVYGGRMGAPKMQDLPIPADEHIIPEMHEILRSYCINDLNTTQMLYETLTPQIKLRESMSEQYGIDLRSKSDAQIAETVIKSELEKKTKRKYKPLKLKDGTTIRYQDPKIVSFKTSELTDVFQKILDHDFEFQGNGSIKLPKWLKETKIEIGEGVYSLGIGGLHSNEKGQLVRADDGLLLDLDFSSYYPNIILQQQLSPKSMGKDFLELYQSLVTRRLAAKASKDMVTANTLKIVLNSSFGKLGNKYSPLYAPELLLQTTITGQLCLLMLIERMETAGIKIVSANTDGIVIHTTKEKEREMQLLAWDFMLDTSYTLERTDYELLASRDVNSYCAIKTDGKVKRKGAFNTGGLMKNPDRSIVQTAVINFLKDGTPLKETIENCEDINEFVTVRKVTGGAVWNGKELGKSIRFYSSRDALMIDPAIHYVLNNNKVPKSGGCRPIMDLGEGLPDDLHYDAYLADAEKLLKGVGHK